ncbi:MAG: glycoside hydrolase family 3 C-terminal domain-containing protein, partial [Deltaproteobacteria bacterium]|nr:glycoside hydrolase family 3 C-terminal domain-containing protein [Deltaproteobacteria bacterium]
PATPVKGTGGASAGSGGSGPSGSGGGSGPGSGGSGVNGTGGSEIVIGGTGGATTPPDAGADVPVTGTGGTGVGGGIVNPPGTGGATVAKVSCVASTYVAPFSPGYNRAQHAPFLALATTKRQTLSPAEAADQMRGVPRGAGSNYTDIFRQPDNMAKGIKGFQFRDGPRGVNLDAPITSGSGTMGAIHGKSTVFPAPISRGAAWDLDLEYRIGVAMGDEMVAAGQTLLLAPTVNILRHPLWGRTQETYGEDVYQLGRLGTASTAGIQQFVPACVKHYAANNIELDRFNLNAQMDQQTLREIYARHFEMILRDGGAACVMAAYNSVNGTKSTQSPLLLTKLLREEFKFNGFVLTDWWAMPGASGGQNPSVSERNTNGPNAVRAGLDMELPWRLNYDSIETTLTAADLAPSVDRILAQKIRFKVDPINGPIGLKPATTTYAGGAIGNNDAHVALAEEAARKGTVLLKNCPLANKACTKPEATSVLPIKRDGTIKTIAVVGAKLEYFAAGTSANPGPGINNRGDDANNGIIDFATGIRTGDVGSSRVNHDPAKSSGPFDGIRLTAGTGITVTSGNTVEAARAADFVVVVAGLTPYDEGEEYNRSGDRTSFALDGKDAGRGYGAIQNNLIAAVAALNKPMVVVLEGGSVIDMPWLASVPAVVMAWYPGQAGGRALGKLLMGDENFSGKLPITWPTGVSQLPPFSMGTTTTMDFYLGYRRFDQLNLTPLFPLGHGLSYTTFQYSNLQVPCSDALKAGFDNDPPTSSVVNVTVDVANMGPKKGDEVVFLFVSYPDSTVMKRSKKELKGFYRVSLEAAGTMGSAKRIIIPLRVSDLKYYDTATSSWQVESGRVQVSVGPNADSRNLTLTDTFLVK